MGTSISRFCYKNDKKCHSIVILNFENDLEMISEKIGSQIYLPLNTVKTEEETSNMEVDQSEATEFDQSEAGEIKYEELEGEEGDIKTITNKGSFYLEGRYVFVISGNR